MDASVTPNCSGAIAYLNLDQADIAAITALVRTQGIREAMVNPSSPLYQSLWRIVAQLMPEIPASLFPTINILSPQVPLTQWNPAQAAAPFWTITQV